MSPVHERAQSVVCACNKLDPDSRDVLLVMRAQEGDAVALARLYDLHREKILRVCRARVRNFHTAEDLTQEAFIRAFRSIQSVEGPRLFYPWVRRIALNLTLDHARRYVREETVGDKIDDVFPPYDPYLTSDDLVIDSARLQTALEAITPRHRAVLAQTGERWTLARIAEQHQISVSAAKVLVFRARRSLATAYRRAGLGDSETAFSSTSRRHHASRYSGPDRRRSPSTGQADELLPQLTIDTRLLWTMGGRDHDALRFVIIAALHGRSAQRIPPLVHLRRNDLGVIANLVGSAPKELLSRLRREGVVRD